MNLRLAVATSVVVLSLSACAAQDATDPDNAWVGTITTEGRVTTVVNESGSVWGGKARLVEEASIGVAVGADEYMFGFINSVYANDERIVVLDEHTNIVRMYDRDGKFLFNVGGDGQGPGEYTNAIILTMDAAGRTFVFDVTSRRLSQYSPDGGYTDSFQIDDFGCCAWPMHPQPQGLLLVPIEERNRETREERYGVRLFSPESKEPAGEPLWVPDIDFEPTTYQVDGRQSTTRFSPRLTWSPTPTGGLLAGASDRYRFEILRPDGSKTIVERYGDPTPVDPDEWEWFRQYTVATWNRRLGGWTWDGAEMPRHKPAFNSLIGTVSGEIWVGRDIGTRALSECKDPTASAASEMAFEPCFESIFTIDVFAADGRYLGEVETPPDMRPYGLYINDDTVVSGFVEDEDGTIMVKRYRLVPPGEQ